VKKLKQWDERFECGAGEKAVKLAVKVKVKVGYRYRKRKGQQGS
jgi:hypothetical protein